MDTKICSLCSLEKELTEFFKRKNRHGNYSLYSWCKSCNKQRVKEIYYRNPQPYKDRAKQQVLNRRKLKFEMLLKCKCVDCGEQDPFVLDFDHIIGKKSGSISTMFRNSSWEKLQAELKKCVIRCSNCHRKKTAKERNWYKDLICEGG